VPATPYDLLSSFNTSFRVKLINTVFSVLFFKAEAEVKSQPKTAS